MTQTPDDVLRRWHQAVNDGDVEAAVACCADQVAVLGPRGTGYGQDLVRAWLTRSGIRLEPQDPLEARSGRHVVRELARWTRPDAAGPGLEQTVTWCVFEVTSGQVTSIARYETQEQVPAS